jgi:hypothetical protein
VIERFLKKSFHSSGKDFFTGSVMMIGHFGTDSKEETEIVKETLPADAVLPTFSFARQPQDLQKRIVRYRSYLLVVNTSYIVPTGFSKS